MTYDFECECGADNRFTVYENAPKHTHICVCGHAMVFERHNGAMVRVLKYPSSIVDGKLSKVEPGGMTVGDFIRGVRTPAGYFPGEAIRPLAGEGGEDCPTCKEQRTSAFDARYRALQLNEVTTRALTFLSGLNTQDQPVKVQREHLDLVRDLMRVLDKERAGR